MAEILVMARDNSHPDPKRDPACYKKGDPVVVMPDGHPWGREELNTKIFNIIKVPGAAVEDFQPYLVSDSATIGGASNKARRRKYKLNIDMLPEQAKTAILTKGSASLTRGILTQAIQAKPVMALDKK